MDGGVNMQSNEERSAEKSMDDYLKSLGLHRKKIAKDGSCLFRAVAEQVLHCQSLHTEVRAQCVEFLKKNRENYEAFIEGDFEDYLCKLQDPQQWVGEVEINALAAMYKRDFLIYQDPGKPAVPITDNNFKDKVQLCFLNGNHYDSVYPINHIKSAAMCQSILYELLYERVFKVERNALAGLGQRGSRPIHALSDDNMPTCVSSDESELDSSESFRVENGATSARQSHKGRGRGRLSESLRRSLNPTLYRNVEYNVWQKSKKAQQKLDYCIAAGMQYAVGDRCQVRLESSGRSYNATIKEVPPNDNFVKVYVEDVGLKRVPLWSVRPFNEEVNWSTVGSRDKKLSNGHGDCEQRCKGRGRGKPTPASSSVAQATTPGSGGRVQKQRSVEEQGGTKGSRSACSQYSMNKSVSTADSVLFGLTEEQRLAKEEEERNVALVEIQLRDEHSFPVLGVQPVMQGDGGKRKGGEKKRSQRHSVASDTKSPVENAGAPSLSAGERPRSSTPPLASTTTTKPAAAQAPSAAPSTNSLCSPTQPRSVKASVPKANITPAAPGSTPRPPLASAAQSTKTSTLSYASAAGAPSSPPAAALDTKFPVARGAAAPSVPLSASVFSIITPVLPAASSTTSSSSLHSKTTASPPPSSAVSPPTFIAPIAPSPVAAQGFISSSSFPRSSPSFSSLPHSPSPPSLTPSTAQNPSSSSVIHHTVLVQEAPSAPAQTNSLPHAEVPLTTPQTCQSQSSPSQLHPQAYQNQKPISVSQTQAPVPQAEIPAQMEVQCSVQMQPSVPQTQSSLSQLQHQPEAQYPAQAQSEFSRVQASQQPPGAPYTNLPQAAAPVQPQPPVSQPHFLPQLVQPPHPSQVPHPSLSPSTALTHPSLQTQSPNTQDKLGGPPPAVQNPQPEPPALSQQPQPPHSLLHPPPLPQSIPGAIPLQQLSQLYQDPLYPGFPQDENGSMVPPPPFSSSKSGEDLPKDVNILKFFFNLGVKAYTVSMFPPCIYLMPLQQAYTLHLKPPSRSPSPTPQIPASNSPAKQQESYPQYPPNSASVPAQFDHQAPVTEPRRSSELPFNQAAYPMPQPLPQRMPWQQQQMPPPSNSNYPVGYPSPTPPYTVPLPPSQGYPSGQDPGHPAMPPAMPPYPPSSLGYHQAATPDDFQGSKATVAHHLPANGDLMSGHGLSKLPGPLDGPAGANVANANNRMTVAHPNSFGFNKEQEESVLLVDPPLNNLPIHVNMMTMTTSSIPGPHDITSKPTVLIDTNPSRVFRSPRKPYVRQGPADPSQVPCLQPIAMSEGLSVGCSTEDDLEEEVFNPSAVHYRMPRKSYRGRGRGGHDGWRGGPRRRQEGVVGFNHSQYGPSYVAQNWGRGYQP